MLDRRDLTRRRAVACAAALTLVAGGLAACSKDGPDGTVKDFLAGWRSGDLSAVGFVSADGGKIGANEVVDQLRSLSGDLAKQSLVLTTVGEPKATGDIASSTIKPKVQVPTCIAIRKSYDKKAEKAADDLQFNRIDRKAYDKLGDISQQGEDAFKRCFAQRVAQQPSFAEAVKQAQALLMAAMEN